MEGKKFIQGVRHWEKSLLKGETLRKKEERVWNYNFSENSNKNFPPLHPLKRFSTRENHCLPKNFSPLKLQFNSSCEISSIWQKKKIFCWYFNLRKKIKVFLPSRKLIANQKTQKRSTVTFAMNKKTFFSHCANSNEVNYESKKRVNNSEIKLVQMANFNSFISSFLSDKFFDGGSSWEFFVMF